MLHSDGDKDRIKKPSLQTRYCRHNDSVFFVVVFYWEIITLFGMDTTVFSFSAHVKVLHKSQNTQLKSMLKFFYSINFQDLGGMS